MNTAEVKLEDSLGYVLAEDIVATYDIPRFNKSPYDGFAIRSKDSAGAYSENRKQFKVIDHIGAGSVSEKILGQNGSSTYYDRSPNSRRCRCSSHV